MISRSFIINFILKEKEKKPEEGKGRPAKQQEEKMTWQEIARMAAKAAGALLLIILLLPLLYLLYRLARIAFSKDAIAKADYVYRAALYRLHMAGFEREGERHGVVVFSVVRIAFPERERRRPAPHVAIDRVVLLLENLVARLVLVVDAESPVVVQAVEDGAGDEVVSTSKCEWCAAEVIAQIPVAYSPAPTVGRLEGDVVE